MYVYEAISKQGSVFVEVKHEQEAFEKAKERFMKQGKDVSFVLYKKGTFKGE